MELTDQCPRCKTLYPTPRRARCQQCRAPCRSFTSKPRPPAQPTIPAHIAICTPVWQRVHVTRVYWAGVLRLKRSWEDAGHRVSFVVGGSEARHRALAEEHGARWVEISNRPLGLKWNVITRAAVALGVTHLLRLGSDNLICPTAAAAYLEALERGFHFAALRNLYMVEPSTRRALTVHAPGTVRMHAIGPGRMYGPVVLEATKGTLVQDHLSKGMETSMHKTLRPLGIPAPDHMIEVGAALDVKSDTNIWSYNTFAGMYRPMPYADVLATFPDEATLLAALG